MLYGDGGLYEGEGDKGARHGVGVDASDGSPAAEGDACGVQADVDEMGAGVAGVPACDGVASSMAESSPCRALVMNAVVRGPLRLRVIGAAACLARLRCGRAARSAACDLAERNMPNVSSGQHGWM